MTDTPTFKHKFFGWLEAEARRPPSCAPDFAMELLILPTIAAELEDRDA